MTILPASRWSQRGVTLIELMISMTLGLIVLAGIFSVYLASRRSHTMNEALAARQETIRYVTQRLSKDVRMAGYRGCLRDTGEIRNTLNPDPAASAGTRNDFTHPDFLYRFDRYTEGFEAQGSSWSPALPPQIAGVVRGTDVLTVRAVMDPEVYVVKEMPVTSADIKTNSLNPAPLRVSDIVLITDCGAAAIFQITNYNLATENNSKGNPAHYGNIVHNTGNSTVPGNWTKDLGRKYPVGSQIMRIGTISYYIRNSANGTGPALWRDLDGTTQEIAEGVENLQVLYGEDTNGDLVADAYRPANLIADAAAWRRVVAVRVALLAAGTRGRAGELDPRRFDLLGTSVGPFNDGRLRRVVTLTLSLRNRLP
ncbi:MAG TPA: PilW family protein [Solimonas sp.]|nr:PilW family protein [Solimonas sp.]